MDNLHTTARSLTRMQAAVFAREMSKGDLARRMQKHPNTVGDWLGKKPTTRLSSIQAFAQQVQFPLSFLLNPRPLATTTVPFFRSKKSLETQKLVATAEGLGAMYGEAIFAVRESLPVVQRSIDNMPSIVDMSPEQAARALRMHAHQSDQPIANMVDFAWKLGVLVVVGPEDLTVRLDSFVLRVNGLPLVVLNPRGSTSDLRFKVAHELGHLVLHGTAPSTFRDQAEADADLFAAELLYPTSDKSEGRLIDAVASPRYWQRLLALKQEFGMSLYAFLELAKRKGLGDDAKWKRAYRDAGFWSAGELEQPRPEVFRNLLADAAEDLNLLGDQRLLESSALGQLPADVRSLVLQREGGPRVQTLNLPPLESVQQLEFDFPN